MISSCLIYIIVATQSPGILVNPTPGTITSTQPVLEEPAREPVLRTLHEPHELSGLSLDHRVFDFGIVYVQDPLSHDFSLTNTTDHDIRITEIKTDCGCTAAMMDSDLLQPGESASLHVLMTPDQRKGKVEKKVRLFTDLPGNRNWLEVSLRAEFETVLLLQPAHVYFKDVYHGEGATEEITIRPVENVDVEVISAEVIEGQLDLSLTPVYNGESKTDTDGEDDLVKEGKKPTGWQLVLTLPGDTPAGRFNAEVRLRTNSTLQPSITFPVYGIVRSQVSITPTQCYFGTLTPGEVKEKIIHVEKRGDASLESPIVTCDNPHITWTVDTDEPGSEYTIQVKLTVPADHSGRLAGELIIQTNDITQPEFAMPIFGYTPAVQVTESEKSELTE
jgi:Protein of unknown function (DUF1573)